MCWAELLPWIFCGYVRILQALAGHWRQMQTQRLKQSLRLVVPWGPFSLSVLSLIRLQDCISSLSCWAEIKYNLEAHIRAGDILTLWGSSLSRTRRLAPHALGCYFYTGVTITCEPSVSSQPSHSSDCRLSFTIRLYQALFLVKIFDWRECWKLGPAGNLKY